MISNQQFRLKWNNHRNTVLQEFETLLHNNNFVDCTIGADGKYLRAHKIVLSACSPYLQNIFNEHFDKHPVILLKDVSFKELKCMIDYMYCGEVNISECELPSFLRTAQSLKIKGLAEDISDYDSSSDGEPSNSSPSGCNSRTAADAEANVDTLDCSEPPMKKSAAPSLISASGNSNSSLASRKRKAPNSVPIASKPNANSLPVPTSNVTANSCTTPVEVSHATSNLLDHESETEITSNASASATERNVETNAAENSNSNRKRSVSPTDARDSKFRDVKEEPVDTDADNEDNSSYEYANNPCDDSDQLNDDSESNCTNSGKKLGDVSVKSVSCQDQDNEANGQSNGEGIPEEPILGKGCQLQKTKTERQYGEESSVYEYKVNGDTGKSKKNGGVNKACKTRDVVKIIRRLKGSAMRKSKPESCGSSFARENLSASKCNFKKTKPEHSCNECGRSYRWKEGLAMHKRLYCGQEPQFECPHCNKKTFQKINLDTHINASHLNYTCLANLPHFMRQYQCQQSGEVNIHHQQNVAGAGKKYSKSSLYAIKNGCYGPFYCPRCNNHYMWKKNLLRHMKLECGKEPSFQCPICPLKTKHKSSLLGHVRNKHFIDLKV